MGAPLVGIIMGSTSDWETMRHAAETLDALGVAHETKVVSAHRTPKRLYDYAHSAKERGLKLIIAGAGGAAHLPGMAASMTALPVLGVPIESKALKGMDSLLSIVQMPAGVPVGTLAIGKAGAINAALARRRDPRQPGRGARRPARGVARKADRLGGRNARMTLAPGSTIGIIGGGQLGRMLSIAAANARLSNATSSIRTKRRARPMSPPPSPAPRFDDVDALRRFGEAVDVVTYEFENVAVEPLAVLGDKLRPGARSLAVAQDRAEEKAFIERCGAPVAPWRAVASLRRCRGSGRDARHAAGAQEPPLRL